LKDSEPILYDELLNQCKKGNPSAYTALYEKHAKELYNTIYRIVQHSGEAEDVLQDTFIAAFKGIAQFEQRSSFAAWIKRIAINQSISVLRKRRIRFVETEIDVLGDTADETSLDESDFQFKVDAVKDAINDLSPGYRTVVQLYLLDGIPQEEIAQILGITNSTVRTQYHRAKQQIIMTLKKSRVYE
jgi:RNA polymerase sigma-70 factor (ECF subfamily)